MIALDPEEYRAAIGDAAAEDISGGTVYDALIARCALKSKATVIYTWNLKHFRRVGPEVASRARTPRADLQFHSPQPQRIRNHRN